MQGKGAHKKEQVKRIFPVALALVFMTGGITGVFSYYAGAGLLATLRNTVFLTLCAIVLAFLYAGAFVRQTLLYDNALHPGRFLSAYGLCLVFACAMYFVPFTAWPYAVVYVLLVLLTNELTGVYASTVLLMLSVLLAGNTSRSALFIYLATGLCAAGLLYGLDHTTRLRSVVFPVLFVQAACTATGYLLFVHSGVGTEEIVIPLINLCITALLMLLTLRLFVVNVLHKNANRYLDINDPEFSLMQAIRAKNTEEYFRAVHTAYLAERTAAAAGWHAAAAKTCALYHRIGCLDGKETVWEESDHYFTEFDFPPEAISLLHEYIEEGETAPESGEAACVLMCDTLVASLMYIFKKDKDAKVDYDDMIERLFTHKIQEGTFFSCRATMRQLEDMKTALKKEKLYYDFLR